MKLSIDEVSVVQLKKWLAALGLSTQGCKTELVARLNGVPANLRGSAPEVEQGEEESDQTGVSQTVQMQQEEIDRNENILRELSEQIDAAKKQLKNFHTRQLDRDGSSKRAEISANGVDAEVEFEERATDARQKGASENCVINTTHNDEVMSMMFKLAKEIMVEFTGEESISNWIAQLNNVSQLYQLTDMQKKLLCMAKLKGKAMQWIHDDSSRIVQPLGTLLDGLAAAFGSKISKAEMRRKFGARIWSVDEKFTQYYEEKIRLAREIRLDVDELLDGLIEGIPNAVLRAQARIQCFEDPSKLVRAFAEVRLPLHRSTGGKGTTAVGPGLDNAMKETRCFNCNYKGHWARDCQKPKREKGTCYHCGAKDHMVAQCTKRKDDIGNNFNAS
ncbi:uncharacterized protein LOC116803954 [Drosophila mojavensis]|uniref:uncharacterized protein LOC116803836 n=3 Tax=Drosophila mojavensis TaxID=7230 RepID=UPI0013EE6BD8|nr:uncharacterized protein LOC116803836 [Drosophila mojavensis]XP_032585134.2 uncharacterized protein LOC116803954 [Drosophila mojavensis]